MRTIAGVRHYAASLSVRRALPSAWRRPDCAQANPGWRLRGTSPTSPGRRDDRRVHVRKRTPLQSTASTCFRYLRHAGRGNTSHPCPVHPGRVPWAAEMRYPMEAPGRGCGGDLDPIGQHRTSGGRLAQRESASFTPRRSLVRSQYRPPGQRLCGSPSRSLLGSHSCNGQHPAGVCEHPAGGPGAADRRHRGSAPA